MPRGFSNHEKEIIHSSLIENGRRLFGTHGLKKTSVDDLTKAAGISKGAFYLFYDSKEELFFDIIEQFEAEFRSTMLKAIAQRDTSSKQHFKDVLVRMFTLWKESSFFANFSKEEYAQLVRKLPAEKVQAHLDSDESFIHEFINTWQRQGVIIKGEPKIVLGLIRALFFVSLHENDFSDGVYADVMNLLLTLVSDHLVQE